MKIKCNYVACKHNLKKYCIKEKIERQETSVCVRCKDFEPKYIGEIINEEDMYILDDSFIVSKEEASKWKKLIKLISEKITNKTLLL